jgi:hypothetical protein
MTTKTTKQIGDENRRRAAAATKDLNRRMAKNANRNVAILRDEIAKLENGRYNPARSIVIANLKRDLSNEISDLERYLGELKR